MRRIDAASARRGRNWQPNGRCRRLPHPGSGILTGEGRGAGQMIRGDSHSSKGCARATRNSEKLLVLNRTGCRKIGRDTLTAVLAVAFYPMRHSPGGSVTKRGVWGAVSGGGGDDDGEV